MFLDDAYCEAFRDRHGHRAGPHRPQLWGVVTSPARLAQRAWMSAAVAAMPEPGRTKLVSRLEQDESFLAAYHELALAATLQSTGSVVAYERQFGQLTPDLTLLGDDGSPALVVEAKTSFRPDEQRREGRRWADLQHRVRAIPRPFIVVVSDLANRTPRAPDSRQSRGLAAELQTWLMTPGIARGAVADIGGYRFRAFQGHPGTNTILPLPGRSNWCNSDTVLATIREKAKKYHRLANYLGIPLIVALAAEPGSPLSMDLLQAALTGKQAVTATLDLFMESSSSGPIKMRLAEEPETFVPALSAVAWLDPSIDEPGIMTVFSVPSASRPHGLRSSSIIVVHP